MTFQAPQDITDLCDIHHLLLPRLPDLVTWYEMLVCRLGRNHLKGLLTTERGMQVDVMGSAPAEEQGRLLQEAGNAVKRNAFFMKKAMVRRPVKSLP